MKTIRTGRPPVIIIGMHRSGTTMITRLLNELGLFVGERKDDNHEAWYFIQANNWLLQQCGGAWDYPTVMDPLFVPENEWVRTALRDHLHARIRSPRVASFLGWREYLRSRSLMHVDFPWGWKDPRTTVTLPLWTELFPEARVIHVYRHGVDVAASLVRRRERLKAKVEERASRPAWRAIFSRAQLGFATTVRCTALRDAFELYTEYMIRARKNLDQIPGEYVEVKYENFLENPQSQLAELAAFCGLNPSTAAVERICAAVRDDRAYAYREQSHLRAFANDISEELARFGYDVQ